MIVSKCKIILHFTINGIISPFGKGGSERNGEAANHSKSQTHLWPPAHQTPHAIATMATIVKTRMVRCVDNDWNRGLFVNDKVALLESHEEYLINIVTGASQVSRSLSVCGDLKRQLYGRGPEGPSQGHHHLLNFSLSLVSANQCGFKADVVDLIPFKAMNTFS